ncbi:MAG: flagellar biosynthetic protein FliR [Myxococcota bacterium]
MLDVLRDPATRMAIERAIVLAALVAARMAPIVQFAPFLGGKATPQTVKIGLILTLTMLVYPLVWSTGAADMLTMNALVLTTLLLKETLLGVMFGFVASLVFEATRIAGQLIDNARGQTMATAMVPQLPERVSISADILYQLSVVTFLAIGGHKIFLAALVGSFKAVPPQSMPDMGAHLGGLVFGILRLGADAITLGVLLAFPIVAAVLLTEACLALVNKAAPQINVFFLGMPLKAMIGVGVLLFSLNTILERVLDEALAAVDFLAQAMGALGGTL